MYRSRFFFFEGLLLQYSCIPHNFNTHKVTSPVKGGCLENSVLSSRNFTFKTDLCKFNNKDVIKCEGEFYLLFSNILKHAGNGLACSLFSSFKGSLGLYVKFKLLILQPKQIN